MPDGLDPAGCLGLRNSNLSCRAEPFRSGAVVDECPHRLGVVLRCCSPGICVVRCDAASPGFTDIVTVNLDVLLQRDMEMVVTSS